MAGRLPHLQTRYLPLEEQGTMQDLQQAVANRHVDFLPRCIGLMSIWESSCLGITLRLIYMRNEGPCPMNRYCNLQGKEREANIDRDNTQGSKVKD